ncbi:hypothetical protein [Streptomyces sp. bgisy100]|uniref:hypothetical protein n=1 Tax=Streptomyces sp. bgisy100 TaxID=3413783 RepID=UPI003D717707
MPSKGEIKENFPPSCTPAQVQLVKALGTLYRQVDLSLRSIEVEVHYSRNSISKYLNAKSPPPVTFIERFHGLAHKRAQASGGTASVTLSGLRELHARAAVRPCSDCPSISVPREPPSTSEDGPPISVEAQQIQKAADRSRKPARSQASRHRSAKELRRLLDRRRSDTVSQYVAPVPLQDGDRRHDTNGQEAWEGLEEVLRHLNRGNTLDAAELLRHHGTSLPPEELPKAVAACRSAGFHDAAELMLSSAGLRHVNAVLNLASAFNDQQRHSDLEVLLRAARRATASRGTRPFHEHRQ